MNRILCYKVGVLDTDELILCRLFMRLNNLVMDEVINWRLCMIYSRGKVSPGGFVIDIYDEYVSNFNDLFRLVEGKGLLVC